MPDLEVEIPNVRLCLQPIEEHRDDGARPGCGGSDDSFTPDVVSRVAYRLGCAEGSALEIGFGEPNRGARLVGSEIEQRSEPELVAVQASREKVVRAETRPVGHPG